MTGVGCFQDPYVLIMYGGHSRKVRPCESGGVKPIWGPEHDNQQYFLFPKRMGSKLVIEVWNENPYGFSEDLIGTVKVKY